MTAGMLEREPVQLGFPGLLIANRLAVIKKETPDKSKAHYWQYSIFAMIWTNLNEETVRVCNPVVTPRLSVIN